MTIRKRRITLSPAGGAGVSVATGTITFSRPGFIRAIAVDYTSQAATTDLVIKADNSSGATLFTKANNATDIAATPVGMPGMDEGGAATAATDVGSGGFPFSYALYFDIAQADVSTANAKDIVVDVWVEL